ncbi:carboxypeptidase-like regulatory domain-containing protein [Pontibacter sp. MBLB2868]|uniref:carboxypeptidase-like regulatory domain-containing protein n=1 Tax=Pontibacter sp. MBLB2868 TaxID=3451555 RepID=UPI003F75416E
MKRHLLRTTTFGITLLRCLILLYSAEAQQHQQVIQFSGLITATDSATALAGVVVYVPDSQRGTVSNQQGFFSLPVLAADSIVIAALGYQKQAIIIPKGYSKNSYSVNISLAESLHELPTVDVMPWATERDLREAIKNVKLPTQQDAEENDIEMLIKKYGTPAYPMDGTKNAGYGIQQQMRQQQGRYFVPSDVKFLSIPIRRRKKKK